MESQLLECLVAPPDTVTSPIHRGAVTLIKDRAIVPLATQSTQRAPKAWQQQKALREKLSLNFSSGPMQLGDVPYLS